MEKKGTARLAGHRLGEQRLAGARRPNQQRALGQSSAQASELLRVLEELDDLLQLGLRLVAPGHVGKGELRCVAREKLRLRLAEREGAASARLQLAQEEEPEAEHHDPGQQVDEHGAEARLGLARGDRHARVLDALHELLAVRDRQEYGEALRAPAILRHGTLEVALDTLAVEYFDTRDVAPLEFMAELAIGKLRRRAPLAAHHLEER